MSMSEETCEELPWKPEPGDCHLSIKVIEQDGHQFNAIYHTIEGEGIPRFDKICIDLENAKPGYHLAAQRFMVENLGISALLAGTIFYKWYFDEFKDKEKAKECQTLT